MRYIFMNAFQIFLCTSFVLLFTVACQTNAYLINKDKLSLQYLQQVPISKVEFKDALMSDAVMYIAYSMNYIGVKPVLNQIVEDKEVIYRIQIREGVGLPKESSNIDIKSFGPRISINLRQGVLLDLIKAVIIQSKSMGEVSDNFLTIKVPKIDAKPSNEQSTQLKRDPF